MRKKQSRTQTKDIAQRGVALLIAVIFMSVMLTIGLALSSLAYKQQVLSSSAIDSQEAFYAADAGIECALYADQQNNAFDYTKYAHGTPPPAFSCDGSTAMGPSGSSGLTYSRASGSNGYYSAQFRVSTGGNTGCADITVFKPDPTAHATTTIYAQGYNVSCPSVPVSGSGSSPNVSFTARGLEVSY